MTRGDDVLFPCSDVDSRASPAAVQLAFLIVQSEHSKLHVVPKKLIKFMLYRSNRSYKIVNIVGYRPKISPAHLPKIGCKYKLDGLCPWSLRQCGLELAHSQPDDLIFVLFVFDGHPQPLHVELDLHVLKLLKKIKNTK